MPSTSNSHNSSSGGSADNSKVATIATTGATSKIIHPVEDISLEEIRAKQRRYHKNVPSKEEEAVATSSASEVSFVFLPLFCAKLFSFVNKIVRQM